MGAFWKHKTRALLLPTPLAEVDAGGEPVRTQHVLERLGLLDDPKQKLHDDAIADAEGVHVPHSVRSMRPPGRPSKPDEEVPLRALVHPLSGERASRAADATLRLDDLQARYAVWIDQRLGAKGTPPKAPHDSKSFANFWHELYASADQTQHTIWLGQAPGHAALRDHTWLAQRTMASALVGARFEGHAPCLLHVHCGPVQSFIAAARRTNDLWLGSYLVSLLSYQATKTIAELCGPDSVIYPHLASLPLAQRDRLTADEIKQSDPVVKQAWLRASQPNRFVAVVDSGKAREIAEQAANAVLARWTGMAAAVRSGLVTFIGANEVERAFHRFNQQIEEQLDIDIVMQPWPDDVQDVHAMLEAAERTVPRSAPREAERTGQYYEHVFGLGRDTLAAQRRVLSLVPSKGDERTKCTQCGRREAMGPRHVEGQRRDEYRKEWNGWWERLRTELRGPNNEGAKVDDRADREADRPKPETVEFRRGEALCAVCLTKRLACRFDLGGPESELGLSWGETDEHRVLMRFPSVASIAAAPLRLYLLEQAAHQDVRQWLNQLDEVHRKISFTAPGNLLPGLGEIGRGKRLLNPDGTWLYARSYEPDTVLSDHDMREDDLAEGVDLEAVLEGAREAFGKLGPMLASALGRPKGTTIRATPYYAVVVLDVDEMGKWLDGSKKHGRPKLHEILAAGGFAEDDVLDELTKDQRFTDLSPSEALEQARKVERPVSSSLHAEISRRQGELAAQTLRTIVEHVHLGRVVYSGGDDVLAFVPLHTLWGCLRDVERAFKADEALGSRVGLSAGVAIYDWRSPLSLALHTAREAERKAKETGGCLVIDLEIRSGAAIKLRLPWRLLGEDGETCIGDLRDLGTMVTALASAEERANDDGGKKPPLLRPSAVEVLRRELDTLRHEGLEQAFRKRVQDILKIDGEVTPWLAPMMMMGQVVGFLLLLRFLVREQGGMEYGELYEKIEQHRIREGTQP